MVGKNAALTMRNKLTKGQHLDFFVHLANIKVCLRRSKWETMCFLIDIVRLALRNADTTNSVSI
jgi:hypothetical protein